MATTAVQFRRGTETQNNNFTGAEGEVVVDLTWKTLRVHDGEQQGGYALAREDMTNVGTEALASGHNDSFPTGGNLLYANLSNISDKFNAPGIVRDIMIKNIGMALSDGTNIKTQDLANRLVDDENGKALSYQDMSNVDTANLATTGAGHKGKNLSYADMSNIDTANLATTGAGHSGKNLSYQDMSNVDTANLATTGAGHSGKNLAYFDMSNMDTANLATAGAGHAGKNLSYQDMSNVDTKNLATAGAGHAGDNLAYANMKNVNTSSLGTSAGHSGKNLSYTDLSNLANNTTNATAVGKILTDDYDLAYLNMSNVDTANLATTGAGHKGDNLAYANMTNVDTADLATSAGHAGKNLSYQDMSNVDTKNLATDGAGHSGKNLSYADMSNVDTTNLATTGAGHAGKNLAYADMTNVDTAKLATDAGHTGKSLAYLDMSNVNTSSLGTSAGHAGKNLLYTDLSNISTWSINQSSDISSSSTATQIATKKSVYDFADDKLAFKDSDFQTPITADNKGATMAEVGKMSFNQLSTTITNANDIPEGFNAISSVAGTSTNFPSNITADWLIICVKFEKSKSITQVAYCLNNPKIQMVRSYYASTSTWSSWEYTYGQWYAG